MSNSIKKPSKNQVEDKAALVEEKNRLGFSGTSDKDFLEVKPDINGDQLLGENIISLQDQFKQREKEKIFAFGDFFVNSDGVYYIPPATDKCEDPEPIRLSSPIYPEAYLRDQQGESHSLLLKLSDGEIDHRWAMPRRLIVEFPMVSKTLLDLGQEVPVNPKRVKLLQQFLMTARPDKKLRCVDKSGWHGKQYVFPDGVVIGKESGGESVYPISQVCPEGIKQKGTLKEWQDNVVSICKENSRMIFSLGVALAAPCAELASEDSGGFNLKGKSSIGKTKCLQVALSVFGSPKYKRTWKTTSNALEGICCLYNDALLPLDEFGQADAKEAGEIAYMVAQGMGKSRMKSDISMRKLKTWRVLVLSTGESGLEEHMREKGSSAKAGQLARFADVPAAGTGKFGCFENIHREVDGSSFADKIDDVCGKYYGTAAREFIEKLTENLEESKEHLKYCIDDFVADNARNYDGQVARVARRFGLIYAALSLAIKYNILGEYITDDDAKEAVISCYDAWLEDRGTTGDLESKIIIDRVIGMLHENSDSKFREKFQNLDDLKKTYHQVWGYKNGSMFYVLKEAFKNHLCGGQSTTEVAKVLYEHGCLERDKEGKYTQVHRIKDHEKDLDRFYTIDLNSKSIKNDYQ